MFSFKLRRRQKNIDIAYNRKKRDALWREQSLLTTKCRLECFLDEQTKRRSQLTWCRACWSDECCLEHAREHITFHGDNVVTDDEFNKKLKSFKEKRVAIEDYIEHVGKLSSICSSGLSCQPYIRSQYQLPSWLMYVVEQELVIVIEPTFPNSKKLLLELVSNLDVNQPADSLLSDYEEAASYTRRIRFGVTHESQSSQTSVTNPSFVIYEDTSDGRTDAEPNVDTEQVSELGEYNSVLVSRQDVSNSNMLSVDVLSNMVSGIDLSQGTNVESQTKEFQQVESNTVWNTLYMCPIACVKECRNERVLISGEFQTKTLKVLQFKLLLFPGERTSETFMRLKGTFLRTAERSDFNLRWKYDISIPAGHLYH